MTYSLWRGGIMLGRITPELLHEIPSAVVGILQPTKDFSRTDALMQQRINELAGRPVWQVPIPPLSHADSEQARTAVVAPRLLSDEELRGVPSEQLLELRDDAGQPLMTESITVMEMIGYHDAVDHLCAEAGVPFSGWYVTAVIDTQ